MSVDANDLPGELQQVKTDLAVLQATQAGAEAAQSAAMAGQASTNAAAHAGTMATFIASGVALTVGMFLALAITSVRSK